MSRGVGRFARAFVSRRVVLQACKVACVVSPTLVLLNHAELVLSRPFSLAVLRRLALNFLVPYLVSSYSMARVAAQDATHGEG
jgi:hypothetical protein